jgi:hypothetical protein
MAAVTVMVVRLPELLIISDTEAKAKDSVGVFAR